MATAFVLTKGGHIGIGNNRALLEDTLVRQAGLDARFSDDYTELRSESLRAYDLIVSFSGGPRPEPSDAQMDALVDTIEAGTPFIGLHAATVAFRSQLDTQNPIYQKWTASSGQADQLSAAQRRYLAMAGTAFTHVVPPGPVAVHILDRTHPITEGVGDFVVETELYELKGDLSRLRMLAEAGGQPGLYVHRWGEGKVHYNQLGHDARTLGEPRYQRLVVQAVQWALRPGD